MPIPGNIAEEHIRTAARRIDKERVPGRRQAKQYEVIVSNNRYPVMLLVSLANEFANGYELQPHQFGPQQAIPFLIRLGFRVIRISDGSPVKR